MYALVENFSDQAPQIERLAEENSKRCPYIVTS